MSWARSWPSAPWPRTRAGMFALVIFLICKINYTELNIHQVEDLFFRQWNKYSTADWTKDMTFSLIIKQLNKISFPEKLLLSPAKSCLQGVMKKQSTYFLVQWQQKWETEPLWLSSWPLQSPYWRHQSSAPGSSSVQRLMDSICKCNKYLVVEF